MIDKKTVRQQIRQLRREVDDPEGRSRQIMHHVLAMPPYRRAAAVLWYVGVRGEVRTLPTLEATLRQGPIAAIPYCRRGRLELFRLTDIDQLHPDAYGIPEPRQELRADRSRHLGLAEIDLVLVPGVAFDRRGRRLGQGGGYYDRLLSAAAEKTVLTGIAFDCQLVDAVPSEPHDILMDYLVTESGVIRCDRSGRRSLGEHG